MEKKFNFVYITTNTKNGKQYVGDHSSNKLNDNYLGSGVYFQNALNEYGKENFKREILEYFDTKEEAFNAQEKCIQQYNTSVPNGYNISPKGGVGTFGCFSQETIKKMSESHKGKPSPNKGKNLSETHKKNISLNHNKHLSDETKKKISESGKGKHKGIKFSAEIRKKMSEAQKGKKHSDEGKNNISKNNAKYWLGKKRSDETRKKISDGHKGKKYQRLIENI